MLKIIFFCSHAQCLSSLHAWCHWISILAHADGPKDPAVDSLIAALVASAAGAFSPVWSSEKHCEKVYYAGLQLLSSIVNVIRSPLLWNCTAWNQLYESAYDINYLPPKVICYFTIFYLGKTD